jgi:hypothetical protein
VAFDRWTRHRFHTAMEGVCPNCACETVVERLDGPGTTHPATDRRCLNCSDEARVPLFGHVTCHPAVVSFRHERGIDVASLPY